MTPRTFEIARQCVEAGANPEWIARTHYDSSTIGRLKIFGAVLNRLQLDASGRVAVLTVTRSLAEAAGASYDDTEGLINFPLTVKDIQAVAFFKEMPDGTWRVSMRSKGSVDVRAIASQFGGGGHVNAAGCSMRGEIDDLQTALMQLLVQAIG
jgi:phosphoesterase RecJ-like protein